MKAQIHNYSSWIDEVDPDVLFELFNGRLKEAGFGIEKIIEHHFTPQGYTALFLLSESHFAVHTFPEVKQTYIELSSCVKIPFDNFVKALK